MIIRVDQEQDTDMASFEKPLQIVIFPFMAQGHILPLLDISKAFACRGIIVNLITTPLNASSILPLVSTYQNVHLIEIPFPSVDGLPKGCENTVQLPSLDFLVHFLIATKELQKPFNRILQQMIENNSRPICVISDFFFAWTLQTCRELDIPRLVFHGCSALSMAITKFVWKHKLHRITNSENELIQFPDKQLKFSLTKADCPEQFRFLEDDSVLSKFVAESGDADEESWGVVLNSFSALENHHLQFLENFYKNGAKAWCLGPALLFNTNDCNINQSSAKYLDWLENCLSKSVSIIYVSFGSQANLSDKNLDELGLGLEMSGHHFLWVIKSKTWCPPDGLERRVKGRGLMVMDWVDQRRILAQPAVAGFFSHCGWNSVLESLSMGVPLLALPMNAEQPLNAKQVVDELEAGLRVRTGSSSGWAKLTIERQAVCDGVRELMEGEKGGKAREKAKEIGRAARQAVEESGSSYKSMTELIDRLCARKTGNAI